MIYDRSTGAATALGPGVEGLNGTSGMAWDHQVFLDLNDNGAYDQDEPLTASQGDDPETVEDETGQYRSSA